MAYVKNYEILDEIHNEVTRRIALLPGMGGQAYAKEASNLSMAEEYLVVYDAYGNLVGRLVVQNGVIVRASSNNSAVLAVLMGYIGYDVVTMRPASCDMLAAL